MTLLRGQTAVIGAATEGISIDQGRTGLELMARAAHTALAEAGLTMRDVDGLFPVTQFHFLPTLSVAEYFGIRPKVSDGTMMGGASAVHHVYSAAAMLRAGECEVALICFGSHQRSAMKGKSGRLPSLLEPQPYESIYKPRFPISSYALAAARHMYEYGTSREQLADVAVAARKWAQLNPEAVERGELTREDVMSARTVGDPFTVRDCCLMTDGAGAIVMTRAERAKDMAKAPVYVLGLGECSTHNQIAMMPDLTTTGAVESGRRAYDMARLGPSDMGMAMLYDAFTINPILFLEDLGFCKKGEGGAFVENGGIAPGGRLPVNTNGGGLSCCHAGPYGIFPLIEAVRQLRGEAGARQVSNLDAAICNGNGGVLSAQVTAILGTEATL